MRNVSLALLLAFTTALVAEESLSGRVDHYLRPIDFRGVVLIARGDKPVVERTYGMASYELEKPLAADSKFRIASITKTFTGAAIVMLAESGKLSLDDKLSKYAPSFPKADQITLRHLLLHRSGVGNPEIRPCSDATLDDIVADLATRPLSFEPGKGGRYSNGGYALLAHVIEKVSGRRWEEYLREAIFAPLGMKSTMRDVEPAVVPKRASGYIPGPGAAGLANAPCQSAAAAIGSGALLSTAGDLHRWGQAFRGEKLFRRTSLEHPYGWGVRQYHGRPAIEQSGIIHGFASYLAVYPDDDLYVILLSNVERGDLTEAGIGLAGLALGKEVAGLQAPPATIPATAEQRKAWAGRYRHPEVGTFALVERDGALLLRWEGATDASYVFATPDGRAYNRQESALMTLEGDVMKVSFRGGDALEFKRVN